jgi:hypothetical protein
VGRFAKGLPSDLRPIVERLREVCSGAMPGAQEMLYHEAIGYSPTGSPFDRIVYILPASRHVTLGFFFGTHLEDPEHRLVGTGLRMRHVKVRTVEEAGDSVLRELLREADSDAPRSLAAIHGKERPTR